MSTEYIAPITKSQQNLIKYRSELALCHSLPPSRKAMLGSLYEAIKLSNGERRKSTSEMVEETRYCERTLQRSRAHLEGLGLFTVRGENRCHWSLVYRLHDMFFTEEGIAFLKECALLVKKPIEKVVEQVSPLYSSAKCYYYKLIDYLGSSKFNYLEVMYNFKTNKRKLIQAWLDKNKKWILNPMSCLTRKEGKIMEEIGYVEKEMPVEYPVSESVYSPKSEQPIGFNTSKMWEVVHKREKQQDESEAIERVAQIDKILRNSDLGKEKEALNHQVRELNAGMFSITNQILFGLPRQKEAAKLLQASKIEEIKALGDKIKVIDDKQAELLKEKEVLEANLIKYRRVRNYSVPVVV